MARGGPIKMGAIPAPWRDASAETIRLDNQRRTMSLRYASWAAVFPIPQVARFRGQDTSPQRQGFITGGRLTDRSVFRLVAHASCDTDFISLTKGRALSASHFLR